LEYPDLPKNVGNLRKETKMTKRWVTVKGFKNRFSEEFAKQLIIYEACLEGAVTPPKKTLEYFGVSDKAVLPPAAFLKSKDISYDLHKIQTSLHEREVIEIMTDRIPDDCERIEIDIRFGEGP
jgi:hypothetical protein